MKPSLLYVELYFTDHKAEDLEGPKGSLDLISKDGDIKAQSQQGWARGIQE